MKTTAILGMAVVFFVLLFSFGPVHAQTAGGAVDANTLGDQYAGQIGLAGQDIRVIVANIIRVALGLVGMVMVILMIYAGFLWMTAGGNEEQIVKAKNIIKNAVIGLAIVLMSYSIVLFVMRMLGIGGVALTESEAGVGVVNTQNFQGSGALGAIIKDHYPMRNQEEVPRNVKIVVTFRRPVKLDSFVDDTSGNGILGDCKDKGDAAMNWATDCDQIKKGADGQLSDDYINISRVIIDNNNTVLESFASGASVFATSTVVDGVKGVYTIVLRPNDNLGSASEKFTYLVRLGNLILIDDPVNQNPSVFSVKMLGNSFYEWQFSCNTVFDYDPPHVVSVYPRPGAQDYMNTALQINFSEPMDPTGLQGEFSDAPNGGYYVLQGNNIFLKTANSTRPLGSFNIVNNYQTLEFIPSLECGENSCGGKIYCLNVCDKAGANCPDVVVGNDTAKNELFKLVVKAATTKNNNSFEAEPFTGAMDMAGNALDSNPLGRVNQAGVADPTNPAFFGDNPDNYFWSFNLAKIKYTQPPVLQKVTPGLDAGEVKAKQEWKMDFGGVMLLSSLYTITIDEHPSQPIPLCVAPRAEFDLNNKITSVKMFHCSFLDGKYMYYFPKLSSDLQEVHFNCFNPGKGPNGQTHTMESLVCDDAHPENCCAVDPTGVDPARVFCCNGEVNAARNDATKCVNFIKDNPRMPGL